MVIKTIYPSKRYDYLEPRLVRTNSILELLVPTTPISEDGTELPYHESYYFWTNPEITLTLEDIATLYRYQLGEDFNYSPHSEELGEGWYTHNTSSQDTDFSCPSAWGGPQR